MTPTKEPNFKDLLPEPTGLRILRILTVVMTIVMIIGFIIIVSLLSLALKEGIDNKQDLKIHTDISLNHDEHISSVTYSSNYTILVITDEENKQFLRFVSNKNGKVLGDTLISKLITKESKR